MVYNWLHIWFINSNLHKNKFTNIGSFNSNLTIYLKMVLRMLAFNYTSCNNLHKNGFTNVSAFDSKQTCKNGFTNVSIFESKQQSM